MAVVLGIDAVWTEDGSSGVALVQTGLGQSRVVACAPSYDAFTQLGDGQPVDWSGTHYGGAPELGRLLHAAKKLADETVSLIVVDMPLSHFPITGRRSADRAISKAFGAKKCSTHSPSHEPPGPISTRIYTEACRLNYTLITTAEHRPEQGLLEAYPHPAILSLTGAPSRVPYKVQKAAKYWPKKGWPTLTPADRRGNVARQLSLILDHLKSAFTAVDLSVDVSGSERVLKSLEDAVDALVCCWVGVRWFDGAAEPYGNEEAAIWVPKPLVGQSL